MFITKRRWNEIMYTLDDLGETIDNMTAEIHGHIGELEKQVRNQPPPFETGKRASTAKLPPEVEFDDQRDIKHEDELRDKFPPAPPPPDNPDDFDYEPTEP